VSQWVQHLGTERLARIGLTVIVVAAVFLLAMNYFLPTQVFAIVIPSIFLMFGLGLLLPSTKAGAMTVFQHNSGAAASLMKFSQTGLCVVILVMVAYVHSNMSLTPIFLALLIISIVGLITFVTLTIKSKYRSIII
jgi:hypothetical protein